MCVCVCVCRLPGLRLALSWRKDTHTCRIFWHSLRNCRLHGCRCWAGCFVAVGTTLGRSLEGRAAVGGLLQALKSKDAERFLSWLLCDMYTGM